MSIKTRFCARCGKETGKLADGLCPRCYFEAYSISLPKKIVLTVCNTCDAVYWKGIWTKTELPHEHFWVSELRENAEIPQNAEIADIKIVQKDKEGRVEVVLSISGEEFTKVVPVELYIQERRCEECSLRLTKTHLATLQIRTNRDVQTDVFHVRSEHGGRKPEHVQGFVEEVLIYAEKFNTSILRAEEQRDGIDLYFISKDAARHLASDLRKAFRLTVKESYEQYSWDKIKNRPKTRLSILLRRAKTAED